MDNFAKQLAKQQTKSNFHFSFVIMQERVMEIANAKTKAERIELANKLCESIVVCDGEVATMIDDFYNKAQ